MNDYEERVKRHMDDSKMRGMQQAPVLTNDRVALDKDWRIFAEPYLEGFQLTISRGHYDEEVILSADEAKALRDWLFARYPVEPRAKCAHPNTGVGTGLRERCPDCGELV